MADASADWWTTAISDITPGSIRLRGYAVEDLIGAVSFPAMIWLMVRGELPTDEQSRLLERALVAGVDHGPQAPSIAIARMAITCGVGINGAMASATNVLGDVHGGAGQQLMELLAPLTDLRGAELDDAAEALVARHRRDGRFVPGFGHRFHPVDPRRAPLLRAVEDAVRDEVVLGDHLRACTAIERALNPPGRNRPVPMNIDGATAVVYGELGFAPVEARGLFVLSRSVGALAHAVEESHSGRRNKGPIDRALLPTYAGAAPRTL